MALQTKKTLDNGTEANYFKIISLTIDMDGTAVCIRFAGFKDQAFRDTKWKPGNTENTAIFNDMLLINDPEDFNTNIAPKINDAGSVEFAYNLLKERVSYLEKSIDV